MVTIKVDPNKKAWEYGMSEKEFQEAIDAQKDGYLLRAASVKNGWCKIVEKQK